MEPPNNSITNLLSANNKSISQHTRLPGFGIGKIVSPDGTDNELYIATYADWSATNAYGIGVFKVIKNPNNPDEPTFEPTSLSWGMGEGPNPNRPDAQAIRKIAVDRTNNNTMYAGGYRNMLYKTTDRFAVDGNTQMIANLGEWDGHIIDIEVHPTNPNIIYVATSSSKIYVVNSTETQTFTEIPPPPVESTPAHPVLNLSSAYILATTPEVGQENFLYVTWMMSPPVPLGDTPPAFRRVGKYNRLVVC